MKLSVGLTRPWPSVLVFVCFVAGATLQTLAMRRADLSAAYVLVLGLEAALSFGFGLLFFRESASPAKLLGIALIVVGILLLRRGGD
jgi:multidrug transporter EmrE-like cation transporter